MLGFCATILLLLSVADISCLVCMYADGCGVSSAVSVVHVDS